MGGEWECEVCEGRWEVGVEGGGALGCDCECSRVLQSVALYQFIWTDTFKHVGAAAAGFQQELVDQLKAPGR